MERAEVLAMIEEILGDRFEAMSERLEGITTEKLTAFVEELMADDDEEAEVQVDPADMGLAELLAAAQALLNQIQFERQLEACGRMISAQLGESGLPAACRSLIADQFQGQVFEAEELVNLIEGFREMFVALHAQGEIIIPAIAEAEESESVAVE